MGKEYCCICSNFRGKIVGERIVSLHVIPVSKSLRQAWIRRLRLVRKDLTVTKHTEICSEHFVGGNGPGIGHDVPSIFPKKNYSTCTVSDADFVDTSKPNESPFKQACDPESPKVTMQVHGGTPQSDEIEHHSTTFSQGARSYDVASIMLHDYCEAVCEDDISCIRYGSSQTEMVEVRSMSTQTDDVMFQCLNPVKTSCAMTQTETENKKVFRNQATQVKLPDLTFFDVKNDSELVTYYTGLVDAEKFSCLFDEFSEVHDRDYPTSNIGRPKSLSLIDEFFLVLMRLRLGLLVVDLSKRFHISRSCCADVINRWIDILYNNLSFLVVWPSMDTINTTMPQGFKDLYPNTRVVIDCTELFTEKPYSIGKQSQMYSHYKSHITFKALVGVTPNGVVSFVSDLWSGSISDRQITVESGLLDLCDVGDAIMADKGFTISDLTTPRGILLIIPPKKHKRKQLTAVEIEQTRRIANLRIHVERHMERVKNFRILQGIIPITISKSVNKIWKICNALTTLLPPLYPHDQEIDDNYFFDDSSLLAL
ncbi:uncharacterized protein LOC124141094 [Haliotis rufescens]|uniref:uncharacterized protein LOC124141094 n=1 Tax=Haliotis rufescens TaxID=6454 RepID=UPI00201EC90C|nr:uncharacterized protein LOC124141094 [Haliotis rufescens]